MGGRQREAGGARPALWSVLLVYLGRVPSVIFILDLRSNFEKLNLANTFLCRIVMKAAAWWGCVREEEPRKSWERDLASAAGSDV